MTKADGMDGERRVERQSGGVVGSGWKDQARARESQACAKRSAPSDLGSASCKDTDQQDRTRISCPTQGGPHVPNAHALVTAAFTSMRSGSLALLLASGEQVREPHDGGVYGTAGL